MPQAALPADGLQRGCASRHQIATRTVMAPPTSLATEDEVEQLSDLGAAIYRERLKALLEPAHNGEWVAIHVDTGDHALGKNAPRALDALREKQSSGFVVTMLVGPEREDPTLYRMLASQQSRRRK